MNPSFNNELSPAETERLALLSEECAEVIQAVSKILRHGYASQHPNDRPNGPTNRQNLAREIGQVLFTVDLMTVNGDVLAYEVVHHRDAKALAIKPYLHHQGDQ